MNLRISTLLLLCSVVVSTYANTVVTFATGVKGEPTDLYEYQLLKLALEKTRNTHGNFTLNIHPNIANLSYTRLKVEVENNAYENLIYKESASNEVIDNYAAVQFPVDLGAVGYRIGLASEESKQKLKNINNKQDVMDVSIIQGRGWLDGEILRNHGFKVHEGRSIEGLFYMAANNRADIFPIGSYELKREYDKYKYIEGLTYDESICIYYPLPKFYVTNKQNTKLAQRVLTGLQAAYATGEVRALWDQFFLEKIKFANLGQRKIFKFDNPMISKVSPDYEQYLLDPQAL
ncbi:hypothetical protein C2869_01765 [Saccharobesus litoralis]|uniref:Solute-binding protein family 3/N-terminal domain-containing protein n=1 Tax=Saccharobesus litoralis TaxID=2172099 RepID=A0A2S0VM17_9ALTE|nr:hypothetical protein [Saccharobesus litoralis]AWB65248.1 hypothetical protein C2869_01765 [Saccharobesus litoralis]